MCNYEITFCFNDDRVHDIVHEQSDDNLSCCSAIESCMHAD